MTVPCSIMMSRVRHEGSVQASAKNAIKDPHRYVVQVSDTTMMTRATSARTIKFFTAA